MTGERNFREEELSMSLYFWISFNKWMIREA